jgi:hypothetical protein
METTLLTKQQTLVKEIHDTIDREADRMIEEASVFLASRREDKTDMDNSSYQEALKKINRQLDDLCYPNEEKKKLQLESLGFTNTNEVREYERTRENIYQKRTALHEKIRAIRKEEEAIREKARKKEEEIEAHHQQVLRYKREYPFLKFIKDEQLARICKKYKLIYAPVSKYTGDVPQKNLNEIIEYGKIEKDDLRPNMIRYEMEDIDKEWLSFTSDIEMDYRMIENHARHLGYRWIESESVSSTIIKDYETSGQPHQKLIIFLRYSTSKAALYCLFFKLSLSF